MKILLALDESPFAEAPMNTVITQVNPRDAEVYLLHVIEPFPVSLATKEGTLESPDFVAARLEQREHAQSTS